MVPLIDAEGTVRAVLDIDSRDLNAFDDVDRKALEKVAQIVVNQLYNTAQ